MAARQPANRRHQHPPSGPLLRPGGQPALHRQPRPAPTERNSPHHPHQIPHRWIQGQLYLGIADHRLRQAEAWGETVQELTELEPEASVRAIEANPAAAELVDRVFEAATRTGSEDKRYLLARVAAAALSGDTTPERDRSAPVLARPVIALDPPHITLLVFIGQLSERSEGRPIASQPELGTMWPGGIELLDPAIAALIREGRSRGPPLTTALRTSRTGSLRLAEPSSITF